MGTEKFDIVITDTTMPNMAGIQLAKKLMEIRSDFPKKSARIRQRPCAFVDIS
jgi:DNA-binding NarL/FixJ family response regulator